MANVNKVQRAVVQTECDLLICEWRFIQFSDVCVPWCAPYRRFRTKFIDSSKFQFELKNSSNYRARRSQSNQLCVSRRWVLFVYLAFRFRQVDKRFPFFRIAVRRAHGAADSCVLKQRRPFKKHRTLVNPSLDGFVEFGLEILARV